MHLVTNGQRTEKTYLDGLKQRIPREKVKVSVTTKFVNGDPMGVMRDLRGSNSGLDTFDEVWVVVDHDGRDRTEFLRDCARLGKRGTEVHGVVSVPCFEVWLIAHYEQVRPYQDQRGAQKHWEEVSGATKQLPATFPWDKAAAAAERSHLKGEAVPGLDTQGPCPSTTMPHLVARLGLIPRP